MPRVGSVFSNARHRIPRRRIPDRVPLKFEALMLTVPQPPAAEVPDGRDDTENVEIKRVGEVRTFDFTPLDHVELGRRLDIIDIERGVKLAGTRNYILKGDGCLLHQAVLRLALDVPRAKPVRRRWGRSAAGTSRAGPRHDDRPRPGVPNRGLIAVAVPDLPMTVPVLVREEVMQGTGYFPAAREVRRRAEGDANGRSRMRPAAPPPEREPDAGAFQA